MAYHCSKKYISINSVLQGTTYSGRYLHLWSLFSPFFHVVITFPLHWPLSYQLNMLRYFILWYLHPWTALLLLDPCKLGFSFLRSQETPFPITMANTISLSRCYSITLLYSFILYYTSSVQFSCSVMFDSLRPYELQNTRPPYPSPTPGVHPNPCPSSWWCHSTISSSVLPFFSCPHPSQHQGLFQWVRSSHQVAKVLEFQLQHQSFQ